MANAIEKKEVVSAAYSITYDPSPTVLAFHNSNKPFKALAGPPGGGKSVGAMWECIFRAMRQPADNNGHRKSRIGVVRATYPMLKTTTINTVNDWMPVSWGSVVMSQPPTGTYRFPLGDGTIVMMEMIFLALDQEEDLKKLRSLEVSTMWLNEATELTRETFNMSVQRMGRYPAKKDGAMCLEPGVIMDFNLPGKDHWLHDLCEANKPEDLDFYMQPAAAICVNFDKADAGEEDPVYELNPDAENLHNLPDNYYKLQLQTMTQWNMIKSFLLMIWANFATGKVVFPEFNRRTHVAKIRTEFNINEPVYIGFDTSGLHPGAVIGQMQQGTLVVMDEVYGDETSFQIFVEMGLIPLLAKRYPQGDYLCVVDPSNPRNALTGMTPIQTLAGYGIRAVPAPTNNFAPRKEAVVWFLKRVGGIVFDSECSLVTSGLEEGYVYRKLRIKSTGGSQYANEADKTVTCSHVIDALQYLCLYIRMPGGEGVEQGRSAASHVRARLKPRRLM